MPEQPELEKLRRERSRLVRELKDRNVVHQEKSEMQKRAFNKTIRDIVVQSVGTVLGGATLAFLALVTGALPRDQPFTLIIAGLGTLSLVWILVMEYRSSTNPIVTFDDLDGLEKIRIIDAAMEMMQTLDEGQDSQTDS